MLVREFCDLIRNAGGRVVIPPYSGNLDRELADVAVARQRREYDHIRIYYRGDNQHPDSMTTQWPVGMAVLLAQDISFEVLTTPGETLARHRLPMPKAGSSE